MILFKCISGVKKNLISISFAAAFSGLILGTSSAIASGMLPETSVVIVNEEDGEASMNVTNTDDAPALLYTSIENIAEDTETLLIVTPPITRVEGKQTQLVRFILSPHEPLKTQRLKRVLFEGIPQKANPNEGGAKLTMTVRQNLPVIIHPKGLVKNREPWKLLTWVVEKEQLVLKNDSGYVVRMSQQVQLQPAGTMLSIPRSYILPGEKLTLKSEGLMVDTLKSVRIFPATVYGFSVDAYDLMASNK